MKDRVPEEVDCNLLAVMTGMEDRLLSSAARRRIGIPDAEDALQEARLRSLVACRNRTLPDDPSALKGWFCKVFWREVARVRSRRDERNSRRMDAHTRVYTVFPTERREADSALQLAEQWTLLGRTERDREAVRRVLIDGQPVAVAACATGLSPRTIQRRIRAMWNTAREVRE